MSAVIDEVKLPAWDYSVYASQATFRCVLDAMAEPGTVRALPVDATGPAPLDNAVTALCLTLLDFDTPLWRDEAVANDAVASYFRFHCGCPMTDDPADAAFALIGDAAHIDLSMFARGSMEYPDRSTTLFVQVPSLEDGPARTISGPGIAQARTLRVAGLAENFDAQWRANTEGFPLGVDIVFCCGGRIVGLPRTTRIE